MQKYRGLLKLGIHPHEAVEMLGEPHRVTETKYYRRTDWQWFNLRAEAGEFDALISFVDGVGRGVVITGPIEYLTQIVEIHS